MFLYVFFVSFNLSFLTSDLGFLCGAEFSSPLQIPLYFSFWTNTVRRVGMEGAVKESTVHQAAADGDVCLL